MDTPIADFAEKYISSNAVRLHMPGHKGRGEIEKYDITEIDGADCLYTADGIISKSEKNVAELFGTQKTVYSTEGSSLCIKTMLHLAKMYKNVAGRGYALAGRNAHTAFISASILADFDIKWIYPKSNNAYLSCEIEPSELDKYLSNASELPFCVYVTSPDYLGNISDIASISRVCKRHGVLLIVDNAHGAYLKFAPLPCHPIDLGADLCCDSAHKTLPVLTGGAYLHISKIAPSFFAEHVKNVMCIYGSTSPSYLILESLDKCNKYLKTEYYNELFSIINKLDRVKQGLILCGYSLIGCEKTKITIDANAYGYLGNDFAKILMDNGIFPEFYDKDFTVLMVSSKNTAEELDYLYNVLKSIPKKPKIKRQDLEYTPLEIKMSPKEAYFSKKVLTDVNNSLGCVYAGTTVSCPPAVSLAVAGELINEATIKLFKYYNIKQIYVTKSS